MPWEVDQAQATERLRSDEALLKSMLDDEQLFQRLLSDENILVQVSPWLFFMVLLRRTRRDLPQAAFTVEQRGWQKVVLFDVDRVVKLLEQELLLDYLAAMLASFTRIESKTVLVETQKGRWRGYRVSEFDLEGMLRYSQTLDEPFRFAPYKRIGDVCLFLTSMFPEHLNSQYRYPASRKIRPRMKGKIIRSLDDYEAHGRAFYQLAAEHDQARLQGMDGVLSTLSENFILAEKPLAFLVNRYLQFSRHTLFNI